MKVDVLGIPFNATTQEKVLQEIKDRLHKENEKLFIATPNPEMVLEGLKNEELRQILGTTDINIPDGIGILWAAQYLHSVRDKKSKTFKIVKGILSLPALLFNPKKYRSILPERVTGTDLMQKICEQVPPATRIFLLGAAPGIAEKTQHKLERKYHCTVVGTDDGSAHPEEYNRIRSVINASEADILFVAFGAPKQEIWLARNLPHLPTVKVAIGIGGAFDFISGHVPRAPKVMRQLGLEWLFRLLRQPSRIRRIYNATVTFPFRVIKSVL